MTAAQQQRVHGIRRRRSRSPPLRAPLLQEPHPARLHARLVARHLAERLHRGGLGGRRRGEHARGESATIVPVHSRFLRNNRSLLDGRHYLPRERLFAHPLQRHRRKRLHLKAEARPLLAQMLHYERRKFLVLGLWDPCEGMQIEPARFEIAHAERRALVLDPAFDVRRYCFVKRRNRLGRFRWTPQPREPGEDVERDLLRGRSSREPRPEFVVVPRLVEHDATARLLASETFPVEQFTALHTRSVERLLHARARVHHALCDHVGEVAAERLLAAFVRELHQIG